MSETKFTPGPWAANVARLSDKSLNVAHVVSSGGLSVAQLAHHGEDETVANAHLIAAAPDGYRCADLLESLCIWLLHAFGPDSPAGKEASFRRKEAQAMLAKARGEAG